MTKLGAVLLAVVLAGCAPLTGAPVASKVGQAERRHEYPGPAVSQSVPSAAPAPVTAVEAFATTYINWTATTVTARLQTLASLSVGQARAAMTLAAAETARDYELRRGGVANSGTVEAIAPLPSHANQYIVVTRERTTATGTDAYQGLRPAWHVTLATVTRLPAAGWALSGWQPEN